MRPPTFCFGLLTKCPIGWGHCILRPQTFVWVNLTRMVGGSVYEAPNLLFCSNHKMSYWLGALYIAPPNFCLCHFDQKGWGRCIWGPHPSVLVYPQNVLLVGGIVCCAPELSVSIWPEGSGAVYMRPPTFCFGLPTKYTIGWGQCMLRPQTFDLTQPGSPDCEP